VLLVLLNSGSHNPLLSPLWSMMRSFFVQAYLRLVFGTYFFASVTGFVLFLICSSLCYCWVLRYKEGFFQLSCLTTLRYFGSSLSLTMVRGRKVRTLEPMAYPLHTFLALTLCFDYFVGPLLLTLCYFTAPFTMVFSCVFLFFLYGALSPAFHVLELQCYYWL